MAQFTVVLVGNYIRNVERFMDVQLGRLRSPEVNHSQILLIILQGYRLPAKCTLNLDVDSYFTDVLHTVGPIGENSKALKSCYSTCLEVAAKYNLKTIVFCGISTGGYIKLSCETILQESLVTHFIQHHILRSGLFVNGLKKMTIGPRFFPSNLS